MSKNHRKLLVELMGICSDIGGRLDYTATNHLKYIDRQEAHSIISGLLCAILSDHPNNEYRDEDVAKIEPYLEELRELAKKNYPDRNGFVFQHEMNFVLDTINIH